MSIEQWSFGTTQDGVPVDGYTITNKNGLSIEVIEYGANLISCKTPNRDGVIEEITLAFPTLTPYESDSAYLGATVGRVANRIGKGRFSLEGRGYTLAQNDGTNHLHGGPKGLSRQVWKSKIIQGEGWQGISLSIRSPHGEEGYPGNLLVTLHYRLTDKNELIMEYLAESDATTPVNLTNHTYWNLCGSLASPENHTLAIQSDSRLELDSELIATGKILPLEETTYDLRKPKQLKDGPAGGFDTYYILNGEQPAVRVHDPKSGRVLTLKTDTPGVQIYTADKLDPVELRRGRAYAGAAICLEPGAYTDFVNNAHFPQSLATPEQPYRQKSVLSFSVE